MVSLSYNMSPSMKCLGMMNQLPPQSEECDDICSLELIAPTRVLLNVSLAHSLTLITISLRYPGSDQERLGSSCQGEVNKLTSLTRVLELSSFDYHSSFRLRITLDSTPSRCGEDLRGWPSRLHG